MNFENTLIIMTSNAGSDRSDNLMGFGKSTAEAGREKAIRALEEFLRPEFLSRVDEIAVFTPLDRAALTQIAALLHYSTIHHFSRQFKDNFGLSPSEYAKTLQDE